MAPTVFLLIIALSEFIFREWVWLIGYKFFVCFPSSRNDDPSSSISTQGRGRNRTELDLGCREDVELGNIMYSNTTVSHEVHLMTI